MVGLGTRFTATLMVITTAVAWFVVYGADLWQIKSWSLLVWPFALRWPILVRRRSPFWSQDVEETRSWHSHMSSPADNLAANNNEKTNEPKTALVTGSGRKRVGYEIAKVLAADGYRIAVHYHSSEEDAKQNVDEIRSVGSDADRFQADVASETQVKTLVENVNARFGSLDVLVTTSSIWKTIPLNDVSAEDVLNSFRVNTLGTFLACKYAGQKMVEQKSGGAIVTIGDSLIHHPYTHHAAYFTAKGSIPTLTRCFAVELGSRNPNVRVNCIEPGPVMFPEGLSEGEQQAHIDSTLTEIVDSPDAVGHTVLYMIKNPMLTGHCITLDSGRNVSHEHTYRRRRE